MHNFVMFDQVSAVYMLQIENQIERGCHWARIQVSINYKIEPLYVKLSLFKLTINLGELPSPFVTKLAFGKDIISTNKKTIGKCFFKLRIYYISQLQSFMQKNLFKSTDSNQVN